MNKETKPELLAPAGNLEKLKTAVHFGADAVYMGGTNFSLRNYAGNFSISDMQEGIDFAHSRNVKVYIACNIYPRTDEIPEIKKYISTLNKMAPDALIIADPGILKLAKENAPDIPIHLSTQSNTTNSEAVEFWRNLGVSRVNLARELSLEDIKSISKNTDMELETFVHGAMCISYSGRCLLSSYMSGRSANHGECSHPCRWKYQLQEELRPDEFYPVSEDKRGTYIFNSKDLCMLPHIDKFIEAGVDSLKIEGRMKGIFYLGSVVKVYREAIDSYMADKNRDIDPDWIEILNSIANRVYCTGFYFNDPDSITSNFANQKPDNVHNFLGRINGLQNEKHVIGVRNKFTCGESIRILSPGLKPQTIVIDEILDLKGNNKEVAQPNDEVLLSLSLTGLKEGDLLYKA